MTIEALTESQAWLAAGWTMLHFLWVGGAMGLIAALGHRALRGRRGDPIRTRPAQPVGDGRGAPRR